MPASLGGVTVVVSPYGTRVRRRVATAVTGNDGRFRFADAAPGRYGISFQHSALKRSGLELRLRPHRAPPAFSSRSRGIDTTSVVTFER